MRRWGWGDRLVPGWMSSGDEDLWKERGNGRGKEDGEQVAVWSRLFSLIMLTDQQKPQFKIKIKRDKKEKKKGFGIERKHRMRVERKNKRNIAQGVIKGYNRRTHLSSKKETLFFVFWLSTAQGGGGSFKNRKPIGEVGCCESGMAERSHWWTERCLISLTLSLSFSDYLPTYLSIFYVSIMYRSMYISLSLSSVYLSSCLPVYLSIYLSICLSICLSVYLSICGAVSFSVM